MRTFYSRQDINIASNFNPCYKHANWDTNCLRAGYEEQSFDNYWWMLCKMSPCMVITFRFTRAQSEFYNIILQGLKYWLNWGNFRSQQSEKLQVLWFPHFSHKEICRSPGHGMDIQSSVPGKYSHPTAALLSYRASMIALYQKRSADN